MAQSAALRLHLMKSIAWKIPKCAPHCKLPVYCFWTLCSGVHLYLCDVLQRPTKSHHHVWATRHVMSNANVAKAPDMCHCLAVISWCPNVLNMLSIQSSGGAAQPPAHFAPHSLQGLAHHCQCPSTRPCAPECSAIEALHKREGHIQGLQYLIAMTSACWLHQVHLDDQIAACHIMREVTLL